MIRLLATDFDGTLHGLGETPADYEQFRFRVAECRQAGGAWAIITARHLSSVKRVLPQLSQTGLIPDFVGVEDARLYRVDTSRGRFDFEPFFMYNLRLDLKRFLLYLKFRRVLQGIKMDAMRAFPDCQDIGRKGMDTWLSFPSLEVARQAEEHLRPRVDFMPDFLLIRWDNEICVAPAVGTKEEALGKLSDELGIGPNEIFCVGDGPNDLPMIQGRNARFRACVGNASSDIKQATITAGGYVATGTSIHGVLESLKHFTLTCGEPQPFRYEDVDQQPVPSSKAPRPQPAAQRPEASPQQTPRTQASAPESPVASPSSASATSFSGEFTIWPLQVRAPFEFGETVTGQINLNRRY